MQVSVRISSSRRCRTSTWKSFGPTLKDIHSPGEKANIQSVQDFYILLKEMVTRLAKVRRVLIRPDGNMNNNSPGQ